jgi:nucleoside-diphosphate-sugar epimerase
MRTVTVLGAAGFLGSAVTELLCASDIRLRLVARRPVELPADVVADVSTHLVDVTDGAALAAVLDGSDVVVNLVKHSGDWRLADTDPVTEAVNVGVMRSVVETFADAANPPLCVYAGTVGQVGTPPKHPMDGTEVDDPRTGYDLQKLAAERVLIAGHAAGTVRGISLRLPTVFGQRATGPRDVGVVVSMAHRALAGESLTVWGAGDVKRDLVHIDDVASAFVAAIDNPDALTGRHWIVGTGEVWSLVDIFRAVAESVAVHSGRPAVPVVSVPPPSHAVAGDAHDVLVDPRPFQRASGWAAQVPPAVGIDRTVAVLVAETSRTEQRV